MAEKRKVVPIADKTLTLFDAAQEMADRQKLKRPLGVPGLRIGTSAFTANGWPGSFYPPELKPRDYLAYYATKFNTVEVDSTFYRAPTASTVNGWYEKTPLDFVFAAKVPQTITHEKVLLDCEQEFEEFVDTMDLLDDKLGPLLLQFPYFKEVDFSQADFLTRLRFFLKRLQGTTVRYAIEIRNKAWLNEKFADLLRQHNVALALQDQSWMPRPQQMHSCALIPFFPPGASAACSTNTWQIRERITARAACAAIGSQFDQGSHQRVDFSSDLDLTAVGNETETQCTDPRLSRY